MMMKRIFLIFICIFMLFTFTLCVSADEPQADLAVTNGCHTIDAANCLWGNERIIKNAHSVFVYELNSDTLLYAWNADSTYFPASLVKIMTALVVIENAELTDSVTVTESALNTIPSSAVSADLQVGERISVQDLLYCMLVTSSNDAAVVLAEHIASSQDAFVAMMNTKAEELGCKSTVFCNVTGFHHSNQVTTAKDMTRILKAALKYEEFKTIFETVYYTVPATNMHTERLLTTSNYLMNTDLVGIHFDSRVTGGKSGTTAEGYGCIVSTSKKEDMEIICVVLGSASVLSDRGYVVSYGGYPETIALLDRAYQNYSRKQIIFENQILKQQPVINGECDVFLASRENFMTVLPQGLSADDLTFVYEEIPNSFNAPISKGQLMAHLQVWYESYCVAQTDIYAMNDVSNYAPIVIEHSEKTQSTSIISIILRILLGGIILFVAVILLSRFRALRHMKNKRSKNKQKKK